MLRYIKILSITLVFLFSSKQLEASHAMALDIYYEYLGSGTYNFFVKFYRDCDGVSAPTSVIIDFESSSCSNFTASLPLVSSSEVSQLCPQALLQSSCVSSSSTAYPGTEEYIYSSTITLSSTQQSCNNWIVSYNLCCRNSAITNLTSPSSNDIYCEVSFDPTIQNTSVDYSNIPVLYGCVGKQICFNHGAADADLDSLSYELVNTQGDLGNNMSFTSGLSLSNPVESNNTFTFDITTGQMCFTPSQAQFDVLTIKTTEWRKIGGVYTQVGYSTRDVQVVVIDNCGQLNAGNPLSTFNLTSGNQVDSSTIGICAGNTVSFNMVISDPDTSITYSVLSNAATATPGASLSITGSNPINISYIWTPPANAAGQYTLSFVVDNMDCPIPQVSYLTWTVSIQEDLIINLNDTTICGSSTILDASYPGANYLWSTGQTDSTISINNSGLYWVEATKGNCILRDSAQVYFDSIPNADFSYIPDCQLSPTSFTDLSTNSANSWAWDFGDGNTSTSQNPTNTYINSGFYNVQLISFSANGCMDTMIKTINIEAPFTIDIGPDTSMCGGSFILDASTNTGNVTYSWNNGSNDSTLNVTSSGLYWVEVDNNGCKDRDTANIQIHTLPTANFSWNGGCAGELVQFTDLSQSNINTWLWDFGDNTVTTNSNPSHTYNTAGSYGVVLNVTDINGCTASFFSSIQIDSAFSINTSNDTTLCANDFAITAYGPSGSTYFWSNNATTASTTISNSGTYSVTVSKGSCTYTDDVTIDLKPIPVADFYINDSCAFILHEIFDNSSSNIISWSWTLPDSSNSNNQNLDLNLEVGTHDIELIVTNSDGCKDTLLKQIHIISPDSTIYVGGDTIVYENYPAYLSASGGISYQWTPSNTLDDPNSANPVATPQDSTMYYVSILDNNGCYLQDSVLVEVLDRYEIYVPTAFTPNGDGKNDLYTLNGHGIKDYYFMIFDRWGEMIFESNDISDSWNGYINGVESNCETFGYYLKVTYMNHTEETQKGKLTLLK